MRLKLLKHLKLHKKTSTSKKLQTLSTTDDIQKHLKLKQYRFESKHRRKDGYHIFDIELDKQRRSQHESLLTYNTSTSSD